MQVITCISDTMDYGYRTYLEGSCAYHGLQLVAMVYEGEWSSNRIKDAALLSYARTLPSHEIVIFSDGYDTLFTCDSGDILRRYRQFDRPLVFTAERNCWPTEAFAHNFAAVASHLSYLNGGGFVGEAGVIVDLLDRYLQEPPRADQFLRPPDQGSSASDTAGEDMHKAFGWSSQYMWTLIFLTHPELIALDSNASLFLSLATDLTLLRAHNADFEARGERSDIYAIEKERLARECVVTPGQLQYRPTGTQPCQLHFNSKVVRRIAADGFFDQVMPWHRVGVSREQRTPSHHEPRASDLQQSPSDAVAP